MEENVEASGSGLGINEARSVRIKWTTFPE